MTATAQNIADRDASSGMTQTRRCDPVVFALVALTFFTGVIDAVSFLGLGRVFTANMTGNVVLLGFAAAGVPGLSVARSLAALAAFLAGAAAGGRLANLMAAFAQRRWLLGAAVIEAALIFAAAFAALGFDVESGTPGDRLYAMIVLTGAAMGLRTATVRHLGVADLTTTVLTQTLTGLAADLSVAGGNNPRLARRAVAVVAMFAGAAIGALLLRYGPALPLAIAGAGALGATAAYRDMPAPIGNR